MRQNVTLNARQAGDPFDAVILDLDIRGGLGGNEAIGALIETDPAVKAIPSSGSHNDPVVSNFREYGFRALLPKPYNMKELRETLQKDYSDEKRLASFMSAAGSLNSQ